MITCPVTVEMLSMVPSQGERQCDLKRPKKLLAVAIASPLETASPYFLSM